jgi:hypothetical protein
VAVEEAEGFVAVAAGVDAEALERFGAKQNEE